MRGITAPPLRRHGGCQARPVPTMECANDIVTKGMTLSEARTFVETWVERNT
jgi:hypothetical protein